MNKEEAISILQQALSLVKATVPEHNTISQALTIATQEEVVESKKKE